MTDLPELLVDFLAFDVPCHSHSYFPKLLHLLLPLVATGSCHPSNKKGKNARRQRSLSTQLQWWPVSNKKDSYSMWFHLTQSQSTPHSHKLTDTQTHNSNANSNSSSAVALHCWFVLYSNSDNIIVVVVINCTTNNASALHCFLFRLICWQQSAE